jgi:hypothetical protein
MPNQNDVNLNITTNWNNSFTSVAGSNGNIYYFKFTGGGMAGHNNGDNEFEVGDAQTFTITFTGNDGDTYKFVTNAFLNKNTAADLSATNDDGTVTVTNSCDTKGAWNYGVTVEVIETGETFDCDPVITNRAASPSEKS